MRLRSVHSPDSCTRGSYPSCLSVHWTVTSQPSALRPLLPHLPARARLGQLRPPRRRAATAHRLRARQPRIVADTYGSDYTRVARALSRAVRGLDPAAQIATPGDYQATVNAQITQKDHPCSVIARLVYVVIAALNTLAMTALAQRRRQGNRPEHQLRPKPAGNGDARPYQTAPGRPCQKRPFCAAQPQRTDHRLSARIRRSVSVQPHLSGGAAHRSPSVTATGPALSRSVRTALE